MYFCKFSENLKFSKKVYSPLVTFISGTPDRNNSAIVQAIELKFFMQIRHCHMYLLYFQHKVQNWPKNAKKRLTGAFVCRFFYFWATF